jgi:hypothetical protein
LGYLEGEKALLATGDVARTNDRGEYRIFGLRPGTYYIRTLALPGDSIQVSTFFPGSVAESNASGVTLTEGAEVSAIDFSLQEESTFKISGIVSQPGVPRITIAFYLVRKDGVIFDSVFPTRPNGLPRTDGRFEIAGFSRGAYTLYALGQSGGNAGRFIGRADLEVSDKDIEGVAIALRPAVNLKGRLVFNDGDPPSLPPNSVQVTLSPTPDESFRLVTLLNGGRVNSGWEFEFTDILEGPYYLRIPNLSGYVADIRQGGRSVLETGLIAARDDAGIIEVIFRSRGATIQDSCTAIGRSEQPIVLSPSRGRFGRAFHD